MKPFLTLSAVLALAPLIACASSPYDGTWRLDAKRSYWTDGKMPPNMSLTVSVHIDGDSLDYDSLNDTHPNAPMRLRYRVSLDGKPQPLPGKGASDRYNAVAVSRLDGQDLQLLKLKDDDVIVGEFWSVSADGRHLQRRGVGKSAQGKSKAFVEYFERIPDQH